MTVLAWIGIGLALHLSGWGALCCLERMVNRLGPGTGKRRKAGA